MPTLNLRAFRLTALLSDGLLSAVAVLALSALLPSAAAYAEGSAVFASVTNAVEERRLKAKIESDLETQVSTSSVWVNATNWTRLHSAVMSEKDARALVARAQDNGYDAWYNSSGNRWAKTADEAPRVGSTGSGDTTYNPSDSNDSSYDSSNDSSYDYESETNWSGVKPATGDISHLPMAETFPIN